MYLGFSRDEEAYEHMCKNLAFYGRDQEEEVLIEEMAELTKAILKRRRAELYGTREECKEAERAIKEELADVIIMTAQMRDCYHNEGVFLNSELRREIEAKMNRQAERLKEAKDGENNA